MGCFPSKKKKKLCSEKKDVIRVLKEEINEMRQEREKESKAYERDVMVFAFKEAEWKQERKRLREEVKRLKKSLEEKEDKIKVMEDGLVVGEKSEKEWELLGTSFLLEQMREERARRDEAVEKWKQLYLAIKTELDDLIQRTHPVGEHGLYWRTEEEDTVTRELRREVEDKKQCIEDLKGRLTSMEHEVNRRERDIDILRQSLRIMNCKKKASSRTCKRFLP